MEWRCLLFRIYTEKDIFLVLGLPHQLKSVSNLKCKREASLYTCTKQKQYKQILVYG